MSRTLEIRNVEIKNMRRPGCYSVAAEVHESGKEPWPVVFVTDVATGQVWLHDQTIRRGREVVEPTRYGPRPGKAWLHAYYANVAARRGSRKMGAE